MLNATTSNGQTKVMIDTKSSIDAFIVVIECIFFDLGETLASKS